MRMQGPTLDSNLLQTRTTTLHQSVPPIHQHYLLQNRVCNQARQLLIKLRITNSLNIPRPFDSLSFLFIPNPVLDLAHTIVKFTSLQFTLNQN